MENKRAKEEYKQNKDKFKNRDYGKTAITTDHYSRKIMLKKSLNKKTLNKLIEGIIILILIKLFDLKRSQQTFEIYIIKISFIQHYQIFFCLI